MKRKKTKSQKNLRAKENQEMFDVILSQCQVNEWTNFEEILRILKNDGYLRHLSDKITVEIAGTRVEKEVIKAKMLRDTLKAYLCLSELPERPSSLHTLNYAYSECVNL